MFFYLTLVNLVIFCQKLKRLGCPRTFHQCVWIQFRKAGFFESNPAIALECDWGQPPIHKALSVKRSNHSFVKLFFLPFPAFSHHSLVPHRPDLHHVFISWPLHHKLKLSCPLTHVEIAGNPTISGLLNHFDRSPFFPPPHEHWKLVLWVSVSEWATVRRLSCKLTRKIFYSFGSTVLLDTSVLGEMSL